ncbi:MAG: hypothetical protein JWN31_2004 [Frankiales bacterium]|nr:hypothetical protein [Frankiales bacterium]
MTQMRYRPGRYVARSASELEQDRLAGVNAWNESARLLEASESARQENRQAGTEARRRIEALRRTNAALLRRSTAAADASVEIIGKPVPRAVVVHRLEWMRGRLATCLMANDIDVVATEDDGADALGITIAEQPDLLVVEDRLPSVPAEELLTRLQEFAPRTLVATQVEHDSDADLMLAAGAAAVFNRRVPPAQVCAQLAEFLRKPSKQPLILA